jgi:hypothetical protein
VAVQYDIRGLLLGRYKAKGSQPDIACARGRMPVGQCPGDRRWIQLYYDAMILWPRNGTILQARDAMLAADVARFGGADLDLLWQGFAQRGFGQSATVTGNGDTDPVPDFSSPLANDATLTFEAETADGTPVPATIYVGDYQARVTRIADTDPATTGPNRDETAEFVPNEPGRNDTYNFVANASGYGHVRFMVKHLSPGETRNVRIEFPTNLASAAQGASATGDGTALGNLIDDNEATDWTAAGAPAVGRQVVVDLAGTDPVRFKRVKVSALLVPGQNRFTALRSFDLYACTAGQDEGNPTCDGTTVAGWRRILQSGDDAFPAVNPRPVAPDMTLRGWNVPETTATHVKFVVAGNQCTGQSSYHGDQDSDPNNNSDCRVGQAPFVPRDTEVHATELQVFADDATVDGKEVSAG